MLKILMPEVAIKQQVAEQIAQVVAWYADLTPKGLRPDVELRKVLLEMHGKLWNASGEHGLGALYDWRANILIARGMLQALLGFDDNALQCYQSALQELDELRNDKHGETQTWLRARLADLAELFGRYELAETHLEALLLQFNAHPGRVVAAVNDDVSASHWRRSVHPMTQRAANTRADLIRRLLATYMAQEKLSRYRKAKELLEQLIQADVDLDEIAEDQLALCRKEIRKAES